MTTIMVLLLGYQVFAGQANNSQYMMIVDKDGAIIRMDTRDGSMTRCLNLECRSAKEVEK